jgi:hypothetical protein
MFVSSEDFVAEHSGCIGDIASDNTPAPAQHSAS